MERNKPSNAIYSKSSSKKQFYTYLDDDELYFCRDPVEIEQSNELNEINKIENQISLCISSEQKIISLNHDKEQIFPIRVSLHAKDIISKNNRSHIDLVCIIDRSGSMEGEKLELLKSSFEHLLNLLTEDDRVSIIVFNDDATRLTRLMRMTPENKKSSLREISNIKASGGTNINDGFAIGIEVLASRQYKNDITSIFLLSDGCDRKASILVPDTLQTFQKKGFDDNFTLHTFGYGNDHDSNLMTLLAVLADGNFYFIQKLDTLVESFIDCFGALVSVIAQNALIVIKAENSEIMNGINITKAYGSNNMWNTPGMNDRFVTKVSQLIAGTSKDYILELRIPPSAKNVNDETRNIKIASAALTLETLGAKGEVIVVTKEANLVVKFLNKDEENKFPDMEVDSEFMFHLYRVKLAETFDTAKKLADSKNFADARSVLHILRKNLIDSKNINDEARTFLIEDIDQAIYDVRPEVYNTCGSHNINMKVNNNYQQRSNPYSKWATNAYANVVQKEMLQKVRKHS